MRQRVHLDLANDVREGLTATPKFLPSRLFYDAVGSALFEEITRLPEYYLTRVEEALFAARADEMIQAAGPDLFVVELGAGSARKTRLLLDAVLRRQPAATFVPVDVSRAALDEAVKALTPDYPALRIEPQEGRYRAALDVLRARPGRKLVLWIGSSIGNFDDGEAIQLLRDVRSTLKPGDAMLLGTDLRKDPAILVPAYDDAQGVTARFNLNLLERINRELGGGFDVSQFKHVAVWNDAASRMESYLEARTDQVVRIAELQLNVPFARGERILTEYSVKYTDEKVDALLAASGFLRERTWMDPRGWFAEHLARVKESTEITPSR